ncbi:Organic hydroperoxide reductase OsmC/OhrA [Fodinibius salinus]|uniref:Organic hydroperoxide reductase OsmC/OhrA n=1 Tax=Fodinibius salinus TaxID=860790 RepID=A0A5D3YJY7_9BACT|nr:OsmC family protein [Fodinibius salinus]TYP94093.1 Organic hydroperoxide reductase OsmC/OhrA [Fodinibius salinus]
MSTHQAKITWQRKTEASFVDQNYSRKHQWIFNEGLTVPAAASAEVVPEHLTDGHALDPEEAFVASLASCHMLWFLSIAADAGYVINRYSDEAEGQMGKNKEGKLAITNVTLQPSVRFQENKKPDAKTFESLHHRAHERCYIAHSVKTEISINANMDRSS